MLITVIEMDDDDHFLYFFHGTLVEGFYNTIWSIIAINDMFLKGKMSRDIIYGNRKR